jgi:glutamate 5-kinase
MNRLLEARRIVIKIGSALLVDQATGTLREAWLEALADDIAECRERGQDVLVVSSGAIALGRRPLGLVGAPLRLEDSQAAAAAGQIRLAHAYQAALARHAITVAQILLTATDTEVRRRYLNARNTLSELLKRGAVPVVNENDTVATEEIRVGDNDRLAARVATMISADCLILLSDIDGLYTADPRLDDSASFIEEVTEITPEVEAMAGAANPEMGQGGMVTKLQAGRIALQGGAHMAIADGRRENPLALLSRGGVATWFVAKATPTTARKRWIAGSLNPAGAITIDDGAQAALSRGKSLLPAGVVGVEGSFERGDTVVVRDPAGRELGRGLIAYSAADAARILGHNSRDIESLLGYRGREEMIHRDDLVLR